MSKKKQEKSVAELLQEALVPEEEQPYKVPENWVWVRINSIAEVKGGKRLPAGHDFVDEVTEYPYIRVADFKNGSIDDQNLKYISKETHDLITRYTISTNDVYISIAGTIGKTGIVPEHLNGAHLTENAAKITNIRGSFNKFIYYLLNSDEVKKQINLSMKATSQPKLALHRIENLKIPLPPLNEQKRIVDKVERLLGKINRAKQLIEEAKETFELRRAAILDKAFQGKLTAKWRRENSVRNKTGYHSLPENWKWIHLKDVVAVNPPKKKLTNIDDKQICSFIPMQAVSDKTGTVIEFEEREYSQVKKGYTFFVDGDVIFAKITPCMENGKSALLNGLINGFGFGSTEFFVLRAIDNNIINMKLIHYLVRSKKFRNQAKAHMTGAVGQQRVPKSFIEDYQIALPPIEEQNEIVRILDSIFEKDMLLEKVLELHDLLEIINNSLLSKAFRGELGTNDPNEESSMNLLKEIQINNQ